MHNNPNQPQQNPYSQPPPYRQAPYGQPQQPQNRQPPQQYGQPQYDIPQIPNYGPPPQAQKPRRGIGRVILIVVIILVVLVAGGVVAALALNNVNNPATTVTNYYNAIESQDYNSAFTYLDTSAITFQGRTITPQLFSQAGQVVDQTKGKVTAFSIANTSTNSNNGNSTAQVTVSVTRNNTSYDVHLGLRQESSGWKITSLDNL